MSPNIYLLVDTYNGVLQGYCGPCQLSSLILTSPLSQYRNNCRVV